jgi:hypothetical protein
MVVFDQKVQYREKSLGLYPDKMGDRSNGGVVNANLTLKKIRKLKYPPEK